MKADDAYGSGKAVDWEKLKKVGRLALRHQEDNTGDWYRAYYALPDTMDGAILLGQIRFNAIRNNQKAQDMFRNLMREAVGALLEDTVGEKPRWQEPTPAAGHERQQ